MAMESSAASGTAQPNEAPRGIDTPEFINRLAEDLRVKSGSDLPLSCFVEQVKMQLSGKSREDLLRMAANQSSAQPALKATGTSDCFRFWAMPE